MKKCNNHRTFVMRLGDNLRDLLSHSWLPLCYRSDMTVLVDWA